MSACLCMLAYDGLRSMPRLARCRLYVSGLRSDVGESLRNICILDVLVILACVCLCIPGFGPMSGQAQGMSRFYFMFIC